MKTSERWSARSPALLTLAILSLALWGLMPEARADDPPETYRRYDDLGGFQGTIREDDQGNLRFYDEKGQYEGYADRQDDGSWRKYDEKGAFDGTVREDPD